MTTTHRARVFRHTAPDMTPEPTADEVWNRAYWNGISGGRLCDHGCFDVAVILEAREALMAERRGPLVSQPAVLLPDNGQWGTGMPVEIRRLDLDTATIDGNLALTAARAAYLAGDWDDLERALGIPQLPTGPTVTVSELRDRPADQEPGQ